MSALPDVSQISSLLDAIHSRGVKLWVENGNLRYVAPKGCLSSKELETLRACREQLILRLAGFDEIPRKEPKLERRGEQEHVPLTFSQWSHWHVRGLHQQPGMRQISSAIRISGRLDVDYLLRSFAELVRVHEALRTRIVISDQSPVQQMSQSACIDLRQEDLSTLPESEREPEARCRLQRLILQPLDLSTDALVAVRLFRIAHNEHVLAVAFEHLIADGASMAIFLRELFEVYAQLASGSPASLPPVPIQFADYAVWQQKQHQWWLERHEMYWRTRLSGCQRLARSDGNITAEPCGWKSLQFQIGARQRSALAAWCRLMRTTLAMGVFNAYVALILRWYDVDDAVVRYQTDGRMSEKLGRSIGFFASVLHLRIELEEKNDFVDLLKKVTLEYCNAYEHADYGYLDSQVPTPEYARNGRFNWIPATAARTRDDHLRVTPGISLSPFSYSDPSLQRYAKDSEPSFLFQDSEEIIAVSLMFPEKRFSMPTMHRMQLNFLSVLDQMTAQPAMRISAIRID